MRLIIDYPALLAKTGRREPIHSEREDAAGPSRRDERIVPTERPEARHDVLSAALGGQRVVSAAEPAGE